MSEELKPCPFCKTSCAYTTSSGHTEHYVECEDCGCSGPVAVNEIKAVAAWNRRPAPPAAKAVEMDATRAAMALALEAMQDALEDAQLAQSEYDGRTYSFCTSCGADDLQTPTVGKHTPHCAWGKVRAAISELELQIAALSKQGGKHG